MQILTTITPKFQVHIPVSIRRQVGLTRHGKTVIRVEKSKIVIEPLKADFLSLGGTFKVSRPLPAEKIRHFIDYTGGKR